MKVGDIVKRLDNWMPCPWDTEPQDSDTNEDFGIIIDMPKKIEYKPSIKVMWATLGIMKEHPDDIVKINEEG